MALPVFTLTSNGYRIGTGTSPLPASRSRDTRYYGEYLPHDTLVRIMEPNALVAIIGLVLGLLPVALIAFAIVVVVAFIILLVGFTALLDKPIVVWCYVASLLFNIVILVPLAIVCWAAANWEPALWEAAKQPVLIFSAAFVAPTVVLYLYSRKYFE